METRRLVLHSICFDVDPKNAGSEEDVEDTNFGRKKKQETDFQSPHRSTLRHIDENGWSSPAVCPKPWAPRVGGRLHADASNGEVQAV